MSKEKIATYTIPESYSFFMKSRDFTEDYKMVVEWNALARGGKHDFSEESIKFQYTLVEEEFRELMEDGVKKKNKTEVLDALCDLFVVSAYYDFMINKGKKDFCVMSSLLSIDYMENLEYDIRNKVSSSFLMDDIMSLLYMFSGDSQGALKEVMRSNFSKFPTQEELKTYFNIFTKEDLENECKRIEEASEGRYTGVTYKKVKDHYVFLSDAGKILKPITFQQPDLREYVGE